MDAARLATPADLDELTAILAGAFAADPVWGWAFPTPALMRSWWHFLLAGALRHPWTWIAAQGSAAAVWIPPGGEELTPAQERRVPALVARLCGERAPLVLELLDRFAAAHPRDRPAHYYLSLLGTRPDRRGHGHGIALLEHTLAEIDLEGLPAYLESSNPVNVPRYEALGFRAIGAFATPDGGAEVTQMWRPAR